MATGKLEEKIASLVAVGVVVSPELLSKTNQGGLLHRDRVAKKVVHYENADCQERCLVRLYKLYNSKCPQNTEKENVNPCGLPFALNMSSCTVTININK